MLLNKKYIPVILFTCALLFTSCEKKNAEGDLNKAVTDSANLLNNPEYLISEAKKALNADVKFATLGKFSTDSVQQVIAGVEVKNKKDYGIAFALLGVSDGKLSLLYLSPILDGAFEKSIVHKINFTSFSNDLLYYNSKDYFLGSSMGEVFSYIIDMKTKNIYTAHLFYSPEIKASLFMSPNINSAEIKDYFMKNFKEGFSDLKVVSKNRKLE